MKIENSKSKIVNQNMNPEQLLTAVEECIKERPDLPCKSWTICWHKGRLKCLPTRTVKDDGNIFGTFTVVQLTKGLNLEQWAFIAKKMHFFFERMSQCPDPLKP